MKRTATDIHGIHSVITGGLLNGLIRPLFKEDAYVVKFAENGYMRNSSGSVFFMVEANLRNYIRDICAEKGIDLSNEELNAWTELYVILIAPFDNLLRLECIKAMSLYEVSFIHLFTFFMHWVRIQHRLLSHGDADAIKMINNKLDMFSLTCSKPISKSVRNSIIEYCLRRSKEVLKNKSHGDTPSQADSILYFVDTPLHPAELKHAASLMIGEPLLERHLQPVIKIKTHEVDGQLIESAEGFDSASIPLLLCLNQQKKGDYTNDFAKLNLREFNIKEENYRFACALSMMSIFMLMHKAKQRKEGGKLERFNYLTYVGLMDEVSLLSIFGFNLSLHPTAQNNYEYLQYSHYNLTDILHRIDGTDLFHQYAVNIYGFYMTNAQEDNERTSTYTLPYHDREDALQFIQTDLRKIAVLLNVQCDIPEVLEQCEKQYLMSKSA